MSISRRELFTGTFSKAVSHLPKIIPGGVSNMLGVETKKPLSAEEAAFQLTNKPRKKTFLDSIVKNCLPNDVSSALKDKEDKA